MNGSTWDRGRIKKTPWNKWKWEHDNPKSVGQSERSLLKEIHMIQDYIKKLENAQINNLTSNLKEFEKEQQSPKWVEGSKWERSKQK